MRKPSPRILVASLALLVLVGAAALLIYRSGRSAIAARDGVTAANSLVPSPESLSKTVSAAATIWRGTVLSIKPGHAAKIQIRDRERSVRCDAARFEIERVVKGRPASGTRTIYFFVTRGAPYLDGLAPDQRGLVFLNQSGEVVDPIRPILLLGDGGATGRTGEDALEAVKREMIFSLREDVPDAILQTLMDELVVRLRWGWDARERWNFEELRPGLTRLAMSSDEQTAARGLYGLAACEDPGGVSALVEVAIAHASDPNHPSRHALKDALVYLSDPALASAIDPLLDTDVVEWRSDALLALRRMHSIDHLHRFAAALYEDDLELQYLGVTGLAWTLRKHGQRWTIGWGTTFAKFQQNPEHYLSFWKDWWESEGRAKYGKK